MKLCLSNIITGVCLLLSSNVIGQVASKYIIALKKADSAYKFVSGGEGYNPKDFSKFENIRLLYKEALKLKPFEKYPLSRIKEMDKILYDFKFKPVYQKFISKADSLFAIENYSLAKQFYTKANSLYTSSYINDKLVSIKLLKNYNKNNPVTYIKHGSSFGECSGYCYNEKFYSSDLIVCLSKSWNKEEPDKLDTLKMNKSIWNQNIKKIDFQSFIKLPHKLGCPDCNDGGSEWIELGTKEYSWKVEFEYGGSFMEIKNLIASFRTVK